MTTFAEARAAVTRAAEGFDASRLPMADARALLPVLDAIVRTATVVAAQVAARVADSGAWREQGAPSPAHALARDTGTSLGAARTMLDLGRRLDAVPSVADAARAGRISPQQADVISRGAVADLASAAALLALAETRSLGELRTEVAQVVARTEDEAARRARVAAARGLRHYTDTDGLGHLHVTDSPEVVADVVGRLAAERERLFRAARRDGRRERDEVLDLDAFLAVVRGRTGGGDRVEDSGAGAARPVRHVPHILVRVDLTALRRGHALPGETCDLPGHGPVAVEAVRRMIATEDPFLTAVVTRYEQVAGVALLGRRVSAAQRAALLWEGRGCSVAGCNRTAHLQLDHRTPWATDRRTDTANMDWLCAHHHRLKTHHRWHLTDGTGTRPFVPPDDPRHPDRVRHTVLRT